MKDEITHILKQIQAAQPANEAEVETKILLHIFRLLGFRDIDRADKPNVSMYYGREKKTKYPDFILYNGPERTVATALIAIEAKAIGEPIEDAEVQVQSYACWAGTPFYIACNGETFVISHFIPGAKQTKTLRFQIKNICKRWEEVYEFASRASIVLAKERIEYLACYLPQIENLPPNEFFREYLTRLHNRFEALKETSEALVPPQSGDMFLPKIPVTVVLSQLSHESEMNEKAVASFLKTQSRDLFIQGDPGSGKTTLCKRVVSHLAKWALDCDSNILPIYISLSKGIPENVQHAIVTACSDMGVRVFPSLFQKPLARAQTILILDGLDELIHSRVNATKFESLISTTTERTILLTSRPYNIDFFSQVIESNDFESGTVRDLTNKELISVFDKYLGDSVELQTLLQCKTERLGLCLRSPLLALMAIRIAQSHANWINLSSYSLFEWYIKVTHSFFNARTVRGSKMAVPLRDIFDCLSHMADILHNRQSEFLPTLETLTQISEEHGRKEAFLALVNTGIITSSDGIASFIHKSFMDFALARKLVACITTHDESSFGHFGASENSYEIAHSAIGQDEEKQLLSWLSHKDKKVRKRVCQILSYGCSKVALEHVREHLFKERSIKVWSVIVRSLVTNKDVEFLNRICQSTCSLSQRKIRIIAYAIRKSYFIGYLLPAIELAERTKQHAMIAAAFELALRLNNHNYINRLIPLYFEGSPRKRYSLSAILSKLPTRLARDLSLQLITQENSARPLIRLLNLILADIPELNSQNIIFIRETLKSAREFRTKDRKRLRRIAAYLKDYKSTNPELELLYAVCQRLGAYQTD